MNNVKFTQIALKTPAARQRGIWTVGKDGFREIKQHLFVNKISQICLKCRYLSEIRKNESKVIFSKRAHLTFITCLFVWPV